MTFEDNFVIGSQADLVSVLKEFGILPFFENSIRGFSIKEHILPSLWFTEEEGPWEWKGPVIRQTGCAYGKFFENKAAYVMPEVFFELANYRRDGYDFDARFDDGLASHAQKLIYGIIADNAPAESKELKKKSGYEKEKAAGFDKYAVRLQHQCYVLISDFAYSYGKNGKKYGWGNAVYDTPEHFMRNFSNNVYKHSPKESYEIVFEKIKTATHASDDIIKKFIK